MSARSADGGDVLGGLHVVSSIGGLRPGDGGEPHAFCFPQGRNPAPTAPFVIGLAQP
ncbi:hypothetical protein ACFYYY_22520 [Streptomyces sp. NPDC001834]|uniref:hypothetical protein n=1 Tax=unclassified Streptomyces TaxID=2593676 RepID=UPI003438DA61